MVETGPLYHVVDGKVRKKDRFDRGQHHQLNLARVQRTLETLKRGDSRQYMCWQDKADSGLAERHDGWQGKRILRTEF